MRCPKCGSKMQMFGEYEHILRVGKFVLIHFRNGHWECLREECAEWKGAK